MMNKRLFIGKNNDTCFPIKFVKKITWFSFYLNFILKASYSFYNSLSIVKVTNISENYLSVLNKVFLSIEEDIRFKYCDIYIKTNDNQYFIYRTKWFRFIDEVDLRVFEIENSES